MIYISRRRDYGAVAFIMRNRKEAFPADKMIFVFVCAFFFDYQVHENVSRGAFRLIVGRKVAIFTVDKFFNRKR